MEREGLLRSLRADPAVRAAGPIGRMYGADTVGGWLPEDLPEAWHRVALEAEDTFDPLVGLPSFADIVVAVLDSGVAYEDYADGEHTYLAALGLLDVSFVQPWDFVNDDAHPNDDHQHGTHIASIIASQGAAAGIAPGVSLMPLKVLNEDNSGNELDLVEAIWHAIDHGADVINMSLSFGGDYALSAAQDDALSAAWEAGIVMVGAAGNEGAERVTFPAAQRYVLAVGATTSKDKDHHQVVADYTNASPRVDLMAPGGSVLQDLTEDGFVDGILAETIDFQDPSSSGWWFYAGTSQAAAVTSGSAVHLLAAGASNHEVYTALTIAGDTIGSEIEDGYGRGSVRLDKALEEFGAGKASKIGEYYVAVFPWLKDKGDKVEPNVQITLVDAAGNPVKDKDVFGSFQGSSSKTFKCGTDGEGRCDAHADAIERYDASGEELPLAWSVQVDAVFKDKVIAHPGPAFFATDGLEIVLAAMVSEGSGIATSPMGLHFRDEKIDGLGDMADSYVFFNHGTGIATSPMGVLANRRAIEPYATQEYVDLNLDGSGIATSPMGILRLRTFVFEGTGIATSPMGIVRPRYAIFEGTGIATSPMGYSLRELVDRRAAAYDDPGLHNDGMAVTGSGAVGAVGMQVQAVLDGGGWTVDEGYAGATALLGSGVLAVEAEVTGLAGAGVGAEPL
jgi:hypothetical protein